MRLKTITLAILAAAVSSLPPAKALAQTLSITNYKLVEQISISSTQYRVAYRASAVNATNQAYTKVTATSLSSSANTVLIAASLDFGSVPANSTVASNGTFIFKQLKTVPFDPSVLTWTFSTTGYSRPPTANAGSNQQVIKGTLAQLDGSASTDPAGRKLSYQWSLTAVPSGSHAQLSNRFIVNPTITPDLTGTYKVELVVTDGILSSLPSTVTLSSTLPPPTANAGPDQTVILNATVHLDGSKSTDPSGQPLTYLWSFSAEPAGSNAALSSPTDVMTTFVADQAGTFTLQLIVNNGSSSSTPAFVNIFVNAPQPPVANAGLPQTLPLNATVQLDGSGSTDLNGLALSYRWSLITVPAGSSAVLSSNSDVRPTFVPDVIGAYVAQLIVSDTYSSSAPATVMISTSTMYPTANAGVPQTVNIGATVQLDGSHSTDPNGLTLTYKWALLTIPAGSAAVLSDSTSAMPTFVADKFGNYVAQLTVSDSLVSSKPATVTITTNDIPPAAVIVAPSIAATGSIVQLDATHSTDVNGHALTYAWTLLSAPAGSTAALSSATDVRPTFTPDLDGNYTVQLIVNDGTFNSTPATATVSTYHNKPIVSAGVDQLASVGTLVTLDGSGSSDPNGLPLTYTWSFTSKPAGSSATLSNPAIPKPTFTADLNGNYTLQLVVNDPLFSSGPATVLVSTINIAPTANAGGPQNIILPSGAPQTVNLNGTGSVSARNLPLTYKWSFMSVPKSSTAAFSSATSATPSFVADLIGTYVVQLIVNDGFTDSAPNTATITAASDHTITLSFAGGASTILTFSTLNGNVRLNVPALTDTTINLSSDNSLLTSLTSSVLIAKGNQDAPFMATSFGLTGGANLTAFALGFNNGTFSLGVVPRGMTLTPSTSLIGIGQVVPASLILTDPAPAMGVTVAITSGSTNIATITPSATFAPGATTPNSPINITGAASGPATFSLSATGFSGNPATVNVTNQIIHLARNVTVGVGQSAALPVNLNSPAPSGGVTITLASLDLTSVTVSPATVTIAAGSTTPVTQPQATGVKLGSATITASAPGFVGDSTGVTVSVTLNFSPLTQSVLTENTATIALNLSSPAPSGGYAVGLSMIDSTKATVPASVTFPQGNSSQSITITGVAPGMTTLIATLAGTTGATASITVNPAPGMTLGGVSIGYNQQIVTSGALGLIAPPGNTIVSIASNNSNVLLSTDPALAGSAQISLKVNAGSTVIPNFYVQSLAGSGSATLTATAPGYAHTTATVSLTPSGFAIGTVSFGTTTLSPNTNVSLGIYPLTPGTLTIAGSPLPLRPNAAVSVAVISSIPAVGTVTSPVVFTTNSSSASSSFTPLSGGATTISLTQPAGYSVPSGVAPVVATVTAPPISFTAPANLGKHLQSIVSGSLGAPAPAGNTIVTLTSSDTTRLLLATSSTSTGSASITLQGNAGSMTLPNFYVLGLQGSGNVQIQYSAPRFTGGNIPIALTPSGFVIYNSACGGPPSGSGCNTLNITSKTVSSSLTVALAQLDASGHFVTSGTLSPGVSPAMVSVTNNNNSIGTVTTSPLTFNPGDTSQTTGFKPLASGNGSVSVNTPTGFGKPTQYQSVAVTVTGNPINLYDVALGKNLQSSVSVSLGAPAPPGNVQLTLTSSDPSKLLFTTNPAAVGVAAVTVTVPAGSYNSNTTIYAQALTDVSSATLTATATGFFSTTNNVTFTPTGFVIGDGGNCVVSHYACAINTTTFSPDSGVYVYLAQLDSSFNITNVSYYGGGPTIRPGVTVAVNLSDNAMSVGALTAGTVVFNGGDMTQSVNFHPINAGIATLSIAAPTGYPTPTGYQSMAATVTAPQISIGNGYDLGKDLQEPVSVSLPVQTPASGVSVVVTSSDPSRLLLSLDSTQTGSASVTVPFAGGSYGGATVYAQSLSASGTVNITASAAGFATGSSTQTLTPSGVVILGPGCSNYYIQINQPCPVFPTTVISPDAQSSLYIGPLDASGNFETAYSQSQLRPGMTPVTVALASDTPSVGTVYPSSVTFNPGDSAQYFNVHSVGAGTTNVSITSVNGGLTTPSNFQSFAVNVTAPAITIYDVTVGNNMQTAATVYLQNTPVTDTYVTISVPDTTNVMLSADPNAVGTASATLLFPAGTGYSQSLYVQSVKGSGSVTLTATAPGFGSAAATATLVPSGFIMLPSSCNFFYTVYYNTPCPLNVDTLSPDAPITVALGTLDPTFLNFSDYSQSSQLRPGATPITVALTNKTPSTGTISAPSVTFNPGDKMQQVSFHQLGVGTTTIGLTTPAGYTPSSNFTSIATTVSLPYLTANAVTVGRQLETNGSGYLSDYTSSNVHVTISSNDSSKIRFSKDPTILGTPTLTLTVLGGNNSLPNFYVQSIGSTTGSVNYKLSAPGFADGTAAITINPSGFVVSNGFPYVPASFTTAVGAADYTLSISPAVLDPITLNATELQTLIPGSTNTQVQITSSNTSAGTITASPLPFQGGETGPLTTSFHAVATGTSVIHVSAASPFQVASTPNDITANVQ